MFRTFAWETCAGAGATGAVGVVDRGCLTLVKVQFN